MGNFSGKSMDAKDVGYDVNVRLPIRTVGVEVFRQESLY